MIIAFYVKARKGELFESISQANKRMRKMLPDHIKEHMASYGTIGRAKKQIKTPK